MATENKNLSSYDKTTIPNANKLRFGIVVSEWNSEITEELFKGARATLLDCGAQESNIIRWDVPGSFELVYGCRKMGTTQQPDAIIAIGSVVRGETEHFHFVCSAATQGIKELNLQLEMPVIFCVLTDDNMAQAKARSGGVHGNKGIEAAIAAIKMATL